MRKYIAILPIISIMIWLTVDILMIDKGFIKASGDVWKLVVYTWIIYFGGILTHRSLVKTKENCELDDIGLENSRPETK